MGDGTQYAATDATDSISHSYAAAGNYRVAWDLDGQYVATITAPTDDITLFFTSANWVNLTTISIGNNSNLGNFNTFATWTAISVIQLGGCSSLTAFETHPEWTGLSTLDLDGCGLTELNAYNTWTTIGWFDCSENSLPAGEIDDILIALDETGSSGGTLKYENNPGSSDGSRSGDALIAKSNLQSRAWTITN